MSARPATPAPARPGWALWLPLALFAGFVALVIKGLVWPADREIASQMIGRPLPAFALRAAAPDRPGLAAARFRDGRARLLNVFASWCLPCAAEAPQLAALAQAGVEVDGIALRDRPGDLARYLAANGNPYAAIGADDVSAVQLAIGSAGVPESFVIDGRGVIRYQHIGMIRAEELGLIRAKLAEAAR